MTLALNGQLVFFVILIFCSFLMWNIAKNEERWITMGIDRHGVILVVCHTFEILESSRNKIRVISARKATRKEVEKYEEGI